MGVENNATPVVDTATPPDPSAGRPALVGHVQSALDGGGPAAQRTEVALQLAAYHMGERGRGLDPTFYRGLPAGVLQAVLDAQAETAANVNRVIQDSIALNARENAKSQLAATERNQRFAAADRRAEDVALHATSTPEHGHQPGDGLYRGDLQRFGVRPRRGGNGLA